MALPATCLFGGGSVANRTRVARRKMGATPNRLEVTYHGVQVGASADGPVAGAVFTDFQRAVNNLAEALNRADRLQVEPFLGWSEMQTAYALIGMTDEKHRGQAMRALLMYDYEQVSEEEFRQIIELTPNLAAEMNATVGLIREEKAETSQKLLPYMLGGAVLALALRGLVR